MKEFAGRKSREQVSREGSLSVEIRNGTSQPPVETCPPRFLIVT